MIYRFFSPLFLLLGSCQLLAQTPKEYSFDLQQFKSCWLKDMVYESNGGRYTLEDVESMKGKVICFDKKSTDLLGDTVINARYSIKKESTETFTVRNFQVFKDIPKWFKINKDSLFVVRLTSGKSITQSPTARIKTIKAYPYEFAYDGNYLYMPLNGSLFRFEKKQSGKQWIVGTGTTVKELPLTGKERTLNLSYEFFSDPDELIIYDQNSKELYWSGMKGTKRVESVTVPINKVTKLTVKINSEVTTSRWKFVLDPQ